MTVEMLNQRSSQKVFSFPASLAVSGVLKKKLSTKSIRFSSKYTLVASRMASNIDKSLDEIIKEQKKAKRQQQQKQKKQLPKGKRKLTAAARQGKVVQKRKGNTKQQSIRQTGPSSGVRKNVTRKQTLKGKAKVKANPIKNRQNIGNKIIKKARRTQANASQSTRRSNRQSQQKQSRQNQMNQRRGLQITNNRQTQQKQLRRSQMNQRRGLNITNKAQNRNRVSKFQNRILPGANRNKNKSRPVLKRPNKDLMLTVNISNPRANSRLGSLQGAPQNQGRRRRWRQSGDNFGMSNVNLAASRQELRVSVANNLHKPLPSLPRSTKKEIFNIQERFDFNLGKTTSSLNERFSTASHAASSPSGSRTIYVE